MKNPRCLLFFRIKRSYQFICFLFILFALIPWAQAEYLALEWDPKHPNPDEYRLFQRTSGQTYDYTQPVYQGKNTTCTIENLAPGTTYHFVVRVYVDGDESGDSNEVSYTTYSLPPGIVRLVPANVWLETEDGNISNDMQIEYCNGDCSGDVVMVPNGYGNNWDPDRPSGSIEFQFQVADSGAYTIWGRVLAPSDNDDSFWVSMDGGPQMLWDTKRSASWVWDPVNDRDVADPVVFDLTAGNHTLVVKHREDGTAIDKILITNDPDYVPE